MISRLNVESAIIRATRVIAIVGLVGMLAMATAVVAEVFSRWLLDFPVMGVFDFSRLAIGIAVSTCLPLVYIERRNITVRVAGRIFGDRVGIFLEAFGNMVSMIVYIAMAWYIILYVADLFETHEMTEIAYIPIAPWITIMTIFVILTIPVQAFRFVTDAYLAFTGKTEEFQKTFAREEEVL